MKSIPSLMLAAASLVLVVGCKSKDTGAYPAANVGKANQEMELKFVAQDKAVQKSVTCEGIQERYLTDGRLQIVANVRNRENRRIQVQINCVFKDEQHFPVDETPYRTLILTENSMEGVEFTSLNDRAKNYTVRVRQAR